MTAAPAKPGLALPVAFVRCDSEPLYNRQAVQEAANRALALCGCVPSRGEVVLVKPNLLRAHLLSCTHPEVVRAVCCRLLEDGCRVVVGDSPGFGTAPGVAGAIGLTAALEDLGLRAISLDRPVRREVPGLGPIHISRHALEADRIISLPRLKAHSQMRATGAAKNLFGCVSGVHKALAHARHGDKNRDFPAYLAALLDLLPPQAALVDAVTAMHVTGPSLGRPFSLRLVAASSSCAAVDTALYGLLGLSPAEVPLWDLLTERDAPGSRPEHLDMRGDKPEWFSTEGFILPQRLSPQTFHPGRLLISACKRLWAGWRG